VDVAKVQLADERVDPSTWHNYAIRRASEEGHVEVVKLLLADGRADPSDSYNYAIIMASHNGHAEVVKALLADGRADPSASDNYAIIMASHNGHAEVVKALLADGRADPVASEASTKYFVSWNREKPKSNGLAKRALLGLTHLSEDCIEEVLQFLRPTRASLDLRVKRGVN
jgi:ankyrin repeat protein